MAEDDPGPMRHFPFPGPRRFQADAVGRIVRAYSSGKRHVVLSAPTGIGKSAIAMTVARHLGSAYVVTSQKNLQDQYSGDFGIPTVKGRGNYVCGRNGRLTCDFGVCSMKEGTRRCGECPYYAARDAAYEAPVSVLNYTYFLNMANALPTPQTERELLVLDECHNAERELISFASVSLSRDDFLRHRLGRGFMTFPDPDSPRESKLEWLLNDVRGCLEEAYGRELRLLLSMDASDHGFAQQGRKCRYVDSLLGSIGRLGEEAAGDVVVDQRTKGSISFRMLFGNAFSDKYLFRFGKRSLSMSATVFSKERYCHDLGIDPSETAFIRCPCIFPKENRRTVFVPCADLSYRNRDEAKPAVGEAVREILGRHSGERGIIHTVNYDLADFIHSFLGDDRVVYPRGKDRDARISGFMESSRSDLVLISPSLQEGIDLKDDLSRFFVVVKVPYASLADPWTRARMEKDPEWYPTDVVKNIVQMCGRSIRSDTDHAVGYIIDGNFRSFYAANHHRFPAWWKDALVMR